MLITRLGTGEFTGVRLRAQRDEPDLQPAGRSPPGPGGAASTRTSQDPRLRFVETGDHDVERVGGAQHGILAERTADDATEGRGELQEIAGRHRRPIAGRQLAGLELRSQTETGAGAPEGDQRLDVAGELRRHPAWPPWLSRPYSLSLRHSVVRPMPSASAARTWFQP